MGEWGKCGDQRGREEHNNDENREIKRIMGVECDVFILYAGERAVLCELEHIYSGSVWNGRVGGQSTVSRVRRINENGFDLRGEERENEDTTRRWEATSGPLYELNKRESERKKRKMFKLSIHKNNIIFIFHLWAQQKTVNNPKRNL